MANGYRNALVQQIKDAGQELINRAESMVHPDSSSMRYLQSTTQPAW